MAEEIKSELVVDKVDHDQATGYITVFVQWRHSNGHATWLGPVKGYGVDVDIFHKRFNGETDQLLNWIANEHQQHKGANPELTEKLRQLKGKVIG